MVPSLNISIPIRTIKEVEKLYQVLICREIFDETRRKME